ncbi:metallophosphoesterase [Sunxiuqinia sp. sy24]|uniref:metallophosphoesterase n=1 Tax=Sunxiuqinia sp. sy24 TaxID=3461495 RepID=UPI0040462683
MKRRIFIRNSVLAGTVLGLGACSLGGDELDVTFFVAADTHFDPPPDSDTYYHVRAMNRIPEEVSWPAEIGNKTTSFYSAGEKINNPAGVILAGDILDKADEAALELLRTRYEQGDGSKQINYPVYLGLGNHDINPNVGEKEKLEGRERMWRYVEMRHKGANAPVLVENFHNDSRNFSWNLGKLHLVQSHLFAGATSDKLTSSLDWLEKDLEEFASKGEPVVIFQHYGFDKWALKWWTDKERKDLFDVLKKYNVVGIFAGHTHFAEILEWEGIPVFQVNNAWPEIGNGNNDGNGSFAVVRITNKFIDMVTCRWLNGEGDVELVAPFYRREFK